MFGVATEIVGGHVFDPVTTITSDVVFHIDQRLFAAVVLLVEK